MRTVPLDGTYMPFMYRYEVSLVLALFFDSDTAQPRAGCPIELASPIEDFYQGCWLKQQSMVDPSEANQALGQLSPEEKFFNI